ncbi:MAG: hypothetical protein V4447_01620 [Pseudomonadota bacterium]
MRKVFWVIAGFSPLAAFYCLAAIIQAGSLFTGERAQRNLEFWGALFVIFVVAFLVSVALLWRTRTHSSSLGGKDAI